MTESDALQKKEEERKKGRKEEGTERYIYISIMTANPVNRRLKVPLLKVKYCGLQCVSVAGELGDFR